MVVTEEAGLNNGRAEGEEQSEGSREMASGKQETRTQTCRSPPVTLCRFGLSAKSLSTQILSEWASGIGPSSTQLLFSRVSQWNRFSFGSPIMGVKANSCLGCSCCSARDYWAHTERNHESESAALRHLPSLMRGDLRETLTLSCPKPHLKFILLSMWKQNTGYYVFTRCQYTVKNTFRGGNTAHNSSITPIST